MDNVTPIRPAPPEPPTPAKRKPYVIRHHRLVALSLRERQSRINEAIAVLRLFESVSDEKGRDDISWEMWNATLLAVNGARRLLEPITDLENAEDLAKDGNRMLIEQG